MRGWRTTKHENRAGVQIGHTEYKVLSSIFIAVNFSGLGCDVARSARFLANQFALTAGGLR
jgi:hypothetical protein